MNVTITLFEIRSLGKWERFCALKGWNAECLFTGERRPTDEVRLSYEELVSLEMTQLNNVKDFNF